MPKTLLKCLKNQTKIMGNVFENFQPHKGGVHIAITSYLCFTTLNWKLNVLF